jgi:Spy/CpxP family protein refolding chaperone
MLKTIFAALLLAASTASFAQAPQGDAAKAPRKARFDCSQAKDPKACEERQAKFKAAHEKALKACEGKQAGAQRDCMRGAMCAESKDPAKCEARAKEMAQKHQANRDQIREACKDKKGDEFKACAREQRGKK